MAVVTVRQAKTQLSKLIARAEAGEEISHCPWATAGRQTHANS